MLTSFEMIDSSLTSEDSRRVPAAHCSHSTRLEEQTPITAACFGWSRWAKGTLITSSLEFLTTSLVVLFFFSPFIFFPPLLHFWPTFNCENILCTLYTVLEHSYPSAAVTGRVSISGTNSSLQFFRVENRQILSTYAIHFKIIFLLSVRQGYI